MRKLDTKTSKSSAEKDGNKKRERPVDLEVDGLFFCWGLAGVQHCEIPIGLYSFMMKIWTSDKNAEGLKAECFVKLYSFPGSWDWPEALRRN